MIDELIGLAMGIKLVNGKIRPKYGKGAIFVIIIFVLLFLSFMSVWIYGMIKGDLECIIMGFITSLAFGYLLLINPYLQNSNNYYIEFVDEKTLAGFKLYYKKKLVKIRYKVDQEGKIAFADNKNKHKCISYDDNSKMCNFTKYKIANYFAKWLASNDLLSKEVAFTAEF